MNRHLCVEDADAGTELDEFLCQVFPSLSKRFLRGEVRAGRVLVDGGRVQPSYRLRRDEVVSLDLDEDEARAATRTAPPFELALLHEDGRLLVVDKPPALAVEPDRWDAARPSLVGALGELGERLGQHLRIVHRLDRDTSGAVLVARTLEAERELRVAFDGGAVRKRYLALVEGEHPLADGGDERIDRPIGPDKKRGGTMRVREDGKPASTRIRVERRYRGFTLLECEPLTGRTHQLRVHLAHAGFPLAVDGLYGRRDALLLSELKPGYRAKPGRPERPLIARLTLHAWRLAFPGPDGPLEVEAPLPPDFQKTLKQLAKVRPHRSASARGGSDARPAPGRRPGVR